MVLCDDGDCSVCLSPYSRSDRIPRVLHCRHTFCELCLETMSQSRSGMLTVPCPLCRRVSCIRNGLSLQEALWVNSRLWDQILEEEEDVDGGEEEGDGVEEKAEEKRAEAKEQSTLQAECVSSRPARTKLIKLPAFFKKFSLTKQNQERIVPGGNVEMKSWRRLPIDAGM